MEARNGKQQETINNQDEKITNVQTTTSNLQTIANEHCQNITSI